MLGTKIKTRGRSPRRLTISASAGGGWVATPEDFGSPVTVALGDFADGGPYVIEDGTPIEAPADPEQIERDAWQRLGTLTEPVAEAGNPELSMYDAFEELRGSQRSRGRFHATAEDFFTLTTAPSKEGPSQDRVDTATANIAHDLLIQHGREAIQAGNVPGIDPRVLSAVRDHLKVGAQR